MLKLQKSVFVIKKLCIAAALLFSVITAPAQISAELLPFKDTNGHWAQTYISWAVEEHLAQGYGDGSFQPNRLINEAEFLAMMLRAYGLVPALSADSGVWYKPYYDYANNLGWPLTFINDSGTFRRGQAALLLASAANGKAFTEQSAIQWLLDEHISNGRTSATVNGFIPNGKLTRAEALTFFYKLKEHTKALSAAKISSQPGTTLGGIALNDSAQKLQLTLGKPSRIDASENGFTWYIYNSSYTNFMMFGVADARVTALFSNARSSWRSSTGIKIGQTIAAAKQLTGTASNAEANDDYYAFTSGNERTTLFIDRHDGNKIIGILKMTQTGSKSGTTAYSSKLQTAYEQQVFDLANAERAGRGIAVLQWDMLAAAAARSHSNDMQARSYFAHMNPDGLSPFDRMENEGIKYRSAAENIAAGYINSIYAHYGWMNSETGHRETLLDGKLTRLGTGIAFGGSYNVYYTQNFYTP